MFWKIIYKIIYHSIHVVGVITINVSVAVMGVIVVIVVGVIVVVRDVVVGVIGADVGEVYAMIVIDVIVML